MGPPPLLIMLWAAMNQSENTLVLSGTGGLVGGSYRLLTSTDLVTWTPVMTNTFDSNGSFSNAVPATLSDPQRFYRLSTP
jgi:hypothetical protein